MEAVLDETHVTTEEEYDEVVAQVTAAMNDICRRRGYSPNQMVFGRSPVLPGSLLEHDPEEDLSTHSQADQGVKIVERALELRTAARRAVVQQENNRKLRRAVLAAPRPPRVFEVGDIVCVWRRSGYYKKRIAKTAAFYDGPGTVVAVDADKAVWIDMSGQLLKSPPELVRYCTTEEIKANQMLDVEKALRERERKRLPEEEQLNYQELLRAEELEALDRYLERQEAKERGDARDINARRRDDAAHGIVRNNRGRSRTPARVVVQPPPANREGEPHAGQDEHR